MELLEEEEEDKEEEEDANHRNDKEKTAFSLKLSLRVLKVLYNKDDAALGKPTMLLRMHCGVKINRRRRKALLFGAKILSYDFPEKKQLFFAHTHTHIFCSRERRYRSKYEKRYARDASVTFVPIFQFSLSSRDAEGI